MYELPDAVNTAEVIVTRETVMNNAPPLCLLKTPAVDEAADEAEEI